MSNDHDLDELSPITVALDLAVILEDFEPPTGESTFRYMTVGGVTGPVFMLEVTRGDGASGLFQVTIQALPVNGRCR